MKPDNGGNAQYDLNVFTQTVLGSRSCRQQDQMADEGHGPGRIV